MLILTLYNKYQQKYVYNGQCSVVSLDVLCNGYWRRSSLIESCDVCFVDDEHFATKVLCINVVFMLVMLLVVVSSVKTYVNLQLLNMQLS